MTAILVAIDVAKSRNEVLVEMPGSRRRHLTEANTRVEHDRFAAELQTLPPRLVIVGFEPIGHYHWPLVWRLV